MTTEREQQIRAELARRTATPWWEVGDSQEAARLRAMNPQAMCRELLAALDTAREALAAAEKREAALREVVAEIRPLLEGVEGEKWEIDRLSFIRSPSRLGIQQQGSLLDWVCTMQVSNQPRFETDARLIVALRNNAERLCALAATEPGQEGAGT